jgi:hypothetical protein
MRGEHPDPSREENPVHVLWTGGWDSTYRVLQALLAEGRVVQPHYLIDRRRPSLQRELAGMEELRAAIVRSYPAEQARLLPTILVERDALAPDEEVTRAYRNVVQHRSLGTQYEWLAIYRRQCGLPELELCIERLPHFGPTSLFPYLLGTAAFPGFVEPPYFHAVVDDIRFLLGEFRLPFLHTTKRDMLAGARAHGWMPVMERTWFCFHPTRSGRPCGRCSPCGQVLRAGLAYRIPLHRRALARVRTFVRGPGASAQA